MKNFLEGMKEWASWAAFCFSGAVLIFLYIAVGRGQSEIAIKDIVSLLLISLVGTFLQYLFFGPRIIKRMHYLLRLFVFDLLMLALLIPTAYFFAWFPTDSPDYWLGFLGIYFAAFIGIAVSFEIYFKVSGKKYDGLLGQYRKRLEESKSLDD